MKNFKSLFVLSLLTFFIAPNLTLAGPTEGSTAWLLNDDLALFTIPFTLGNTGHDVYVPLTAVRDQKAKSKQNSLGFKVTANGGLSTSLGTATGLVLSSDSTLDPQGQYITKAGSTGHFTLLIILSVPKTDSVKGVGISLTDLPFYWDSVKTYQSLNPSELQYFYTPAVK